MKYLIEQLEFDNIIKTATDSAKNAASNKASQDTWNIVRQILKDPTKVKITFEGSPPWIQETATDLIDLSSSHTKVAKLIKE